MIRLWKRHLALIMALVMLFAALPAQALAESPEPPYLPEEISLPEIPVPVIPAPGELGAIVPAPTVSGIAGPVANEPVADTSSVESTDQSTEPTGSELPDGPQTPAIPAEGTLSTEGDKSAESTTPNASIDVENIGKAPEASGKDSKSDDSSVSEGEADSCDDSQTENSEESSLEDVGSSMLFSIRSLASNVLSTFSADDSCPHLNTATETDSSKLPVYRSVSSTQHIMCTYKFDFCLDCSKVTVESHLVDSDLYFDHDFDSSGVCTACGYVSGSDSGDDSDSDCKHPDTETHWDGYVEKTSISSTQHKLSGTKRTYCTVCLGTISSVSAEEIENHSFTQQNPGRCTDCNYCDHRDSGPYWLGGEPWYGTCDLNHHHRVYGYQRVDCNICDEILVEAYEIDEIESCDYGTTGVCNLCGRGSGADPDCKHTNTATAWDTNYPLTYAQISAAQNNLNGQHKVSGYQYTYCTDCLCRLGKVFAAEEVESHMGDTIPDTDYSIYYTGYNEEQHSRHGFWYPSCTECSARLGETYGVEEHEDHVFDNSGVCTLCSYSKGGCTHERSYFTSDERGNSTPLNENQHVTIASAYSYCPDCNKTLEKIENYVSLSDHIPNENGICCVCGWPGDCNHPKLAFQWDENYPKSYSLLTDDYEGLDREKYHRVDGYGYTYCSKCNERFWDSYSNFTFETHSFNSSGSCTLCGYGSEPAECSHSETTSKLYDHNYTPIDKDYHTSERLYSKVCANKDCGEVLTEVEPSYTETKKEEHDFTGDKCTLCGYTKTSALSVTVNTSAQSATKGDRISATATASGGSGGYKYGWKVMLDGEQKHQTDMGYGPSYDYVASEEGSYVFVVTVIDSDGNKASAQSGAISVADHKCSYEPVIVSTKLEILSETHHNVITESYTECSVCHKKTETVKTTTQEEHKSEGTAYEAAHPHKMYDICPCGAHPYIEGEYKTVNGKVLDEAECCLCSNHKYGELKQDTKLVNTSPTKHDKQTTSYRQCANCGNKKDSVTVTLEENHSPKEPGKVTYKTAHDHQRYAVCECGAEFLIAGEYNTANGKVQDSAVCCLCHGHKFGAASQDFTGAWKVACSKCGLAVNTTAPVQPMEPIPEVKDEKQELKDYNIEFIKKNALGKDDIYTLFFNAELRAEIKELSEGWASKGYDFIDGDLSAHLGFSQADYYVDTLMKQCAELNPDSNTLIVSPGDLKAICKILGLADTVIDEIMKEWVWDNRDGCIMDADEFKAKFDEYEFDIFDNVGKFIDVGTLIWDCLSDLSVYNAALNGPSTPIVDRAIVSMRNSGIDSAQMAAEYIEDLKDPEKRITYVILKNAGISEKVRDSITGSGGIPAWNIAFEAATVLNGGLFRTNDVIKSNHGTYWSLQLVDELYEKLEDSISQYETTPSDKNYTACMDAYSLYITFLISSYNGVLETRENFSSSLVAFLSTDKEIKAKEKAQNDQYKAILEWYKYDIKTAINDFSIEKVIDSLSGGGFR